jgi:ABC-2 type transport system ATP-binding protein
MPPAIETIGLSKTYRARRGRPVAALADLNLTVERGAIFGLLGANGAGKTTVVKLLLRLCFPTAGEARLLGHSFRDARVRRRIGYLPERAQLYDFLTPRELLRFFARLYRLPGREHERLVERALDFAQVQHAAGRPLGTLSKGTLQRVGLAQAVLADPDLIILDEPTNGLDPVVRQDILRLIRELGAQGKTVLINSHQLGELEQLCDRVGILHDGRLLAQGALDDLLATDEWQIRAAALSVVAATTLAALGCTIRPDGDEHVVSLPLESLLWPALGVLQQHKARLIWAGRRRLTLEEYFLGLERQP